MTYQIQVCDWRSPLASVFYRALPGRASFVAPDGEIAGDLLLKRQYEIVQRKLAYYFDTDFHIKDGILKRILSQKASAQMKAIVESLQETQDRLIRQKSKVLLIQGPAGSGKTSLALHRAAFLMYQDFQDTLTANEILIISPNHLFSQYVSRVLPELGEENITSLTFHDVFSASLAWANGRMGPGTSPDALLGEEDREKFLFAQEVNAFKQSAPFATMLSRLADYYERRIIQLPDVYYNHRYIATSGDLKDELLRDRKRLPLAKRLEQMRRRLSVKIHKEKKARLPALQAFVSENPDHQLEIFPFARLLSMKRGLYLNRLLDRLPLLDTTGLYRQFWGKDLFYRMAKGLVLPTGIEGIRQACEAAANAVGAGRAGGAGGGAGGAGQARAVWDMSDAPGLIWLRMILEGTVDQPRIRQVIVDEAQDYGPLHYMLLKKWFPKANFTVLGDVQQCLVQPKGMASYQAIAEALGEADGPTALLKCSFRSTWEISAYCRRFLDAPELMEPFQRHGHPVEVIGAQTRQEAVSLLLKTINRLRQYEAGSIAVICKTAAQAAALYKEIRGKSALRLVREESAADLSRSLILPIYLAKGLEFDNVILWDVSRENYGWPEQKRFLYLAASRALHRLTLIHTGSLSDLALDET